VAKYIAMIVINLVTPKVGAKQELFSTTLLLVLGAV
jgi:hypothetical protein